MFLRGIIVILGIWSQIVTSPSLNKETVTEASLTSQMKVFKAASDLKITKTSFPGTQLFPDLQRNQNGYRAQPAVEGNAHNSASTCAPGTPLWLILLVAVILLLLVADCILALVLCMKRRRSVLHSAIASIA